MLLSRAARSLRRLPALNSMSCCQPSCRTGSAGHSARHAASTSHAACEAAEPAPAGATPAPAASQPAAPSSRPASAAQQHAAAAPSPPGFARTFYKRPLNPPAIAFSSQGGRRLFAEALAAGTAEAFFPLVEQFRTQDEPAFCGLASLAMVLNALSIDPRRAWKGPWRYYSEALLDCCRDLERVKEEGIVLAQAACLARCNGAGVSLVQPPPVEEGEGGGGEDAPAVHAARAAFRAAVEASCAGRPGAGFLIASYSRAAVGQTGDGHFSPIAAFHAGGGGAAAGGGAGGGGGGPEEEGGPGPEPARVLVLDTARFKYPPHWLPLDSLFAAMRPPDAVTGEPRGWLGLVPAAVRASVLFSLASPGGGGEGEAGAGGGGGEAGGGGGEGEAGPTAADLAAARTFAACLSSAPPATLEAALAALPLGAVARLVQVRAAGGDEGAPPGAPAPTPTTSEDARLGPAAPAPSCHIPAAADALLAEMRGTGGLVEGLAGALDAAHPPGRCAGRAAAEGRGGLLPERVALFLAALPSGVWAGAGPGVAASVTPHPGSLAEVEAAYLARQWAELPELERLGAACAAACACGVGVGEAA